MGTSTAVKYFALGFVAMCIIALANIHSDSSPVSGPRRRLPSEAFETFLHEKLRKAGLSDQICSDIVRGESEDMERFKKEMQEKRSSNNSTAQTETSASDTIMMVLIAHANEARVSLEEKSYWQENLNLQMLMAILKIQTIQSKVRLGIPTLGKLVAKWGKTITFQAIEKSWKD